jgi:hypothetical protein
MQQFFREKSNQATKRAIEVAIEFITSCGGPSHTIIQFAAPAARKICPQ